MRLGKVFEGAATPDIRLASGRLLKLGRRLAVGEVTMRSDGDPRPICHVTGTYAIPPDR